MAFLWPMHPNRLSSDLTFPAHNGFWIHFLKQRTLMPFTITGASKKIIQSPAPLVQMGSRHPCTRRHRYVRSPYDICMVYVLTSQEIIDANDPLLIYHQMLAFNLIITHQFEVLIVWGEPVRRFIILMFPNQGLRDEYGIFVVLINGQEVFSAPLIISTSLLTLSRSL